MTTLKVTAKGQVTLGKELLGHLGVEAGERVVLTRLPNGRIEVKAARPAGKIESVLGMLKSKEGRSLSVEDMNEIIARGWAGERPR